MRLRLLPCAPSIGHPDHRLFMLRKLLSTVPGHVPSVREPSKPGAGCVLAHDDLGIAPSGRHSALARGDWTGRDIINLMLRSDPEGPGR